MISSATKNVDIKLTFAKSMFSTSLIADSDVEAPNSRIMLMIAKAPKTIVLSTIVSDT